MLKQTIRAALMVVLAAALVQAQTPDLQLSPADVDQPAPAAVSEVQPAETSFTQEMAVEDCGCQSSTACTQCGARQPYRTFKEKCAYYRSVRQAFDRGPCCDAYFGGFGPLWDTYCADKQQCRTAQCAPAASCRRCTSYPPLFKRHRSVASPCDACGVTQSTCDCASPMSEIHGDDSMQIGQPPQPTEADAVAPPEEETPAEPAEKATSARRSWLNRSVSWNTNR